MSRRAGSTDNCFGCIAWLVIIGIAVAFWHTGGDLGQLPGWVKIGGPIVAVIVLAVAFFVDGSGGGMTSGWTPPPKGEEPGPDGDGDPPPSQG